MCNVRTPQLLAKMLARVCAAVLLRICPMWYIRDRIKEGLYLNRSVPGNVRNRSFPLVCINVLNLVTLQLHLLFKTNYVSAQLKHETLKLSLAQWAS